jgi:2-dehydropantoate 2-reductase
MKIVVVGTGAVGGWYAGLLALAGHEVHAVTPSDYRVIQERGLILRDRQSERIVRLTSATAQPQPVRGCDLIIVAAKSTANDTLPQLIKPLIESHTLLLTLQNGMGNVEAFLPIIPAERLVAGLCFVCINRLSPGLIENTLSGYIRMAAARGSKNAAVKKVVDLFSQAGVEVKAEDSLNGILWKKLCWNIPFNGLAIAAGGLTTDKILKDPWLKARARKLMLEVQTAAKLDGVPFTDEHLERQFTVTEGMGPYRPSSLIDYEQGRAVEVEALWGEPWRRGQAVGAAMPELAKLKSEIEQRLKSRE